MAPTKSKASVGSPSSEKSSSPVGKPVAKTGSSIKTKKVPEHKAVANMQAMVKEMIGSNHRRDALTVSKRVLECVECCNVYLVSIGKLDKAKMGRTVFHRNMNCTDNIPDYCMRNVFKNVYDFKRDEVLSEASCGS